MIILPERNALRSRILLPVHQREWRQPSQRKTIYGVENETLFCVRGRLNDGHVVWEGWFRDRDDFDAFLSALISHTLRYQPELWRLPTPQWHPDLAEWLVYDFATVSFITSTDAGNQTDVIASDWNSASNFVAAIAGGGSGAGGIDSGNGANGGAGAGFSKSVNLAISGGTSVTFRLEAASAGSAPNTDGVAGKDCWYNSTAFPAAGQAVGAKGGEGGKKSGVVANGGAAASGYATGTGNVKTSGGNSGTQVDGWASQGGGAAAGPDGDGGVGGNDGGTISNSRGGGGGGANGGAAGGNGVSGSAGVAVGGAGNVGGGNGGDGGRLTTNPTAGAVGTTFDDGVDQRGPGGGGGGGAHNAPNGTTGGAGGNYGAAGGGGAISIAGTPGSGGNATQALIIKSYTPFIFMTFPKFNQPDTYTVQVTH